MAATLYNLIVKGCILSFEGTPSSAFKNKISIIAGHFSSMQGFKSASIESLNGIKTIEGDAAFKALTTREQNAISTFQDEIELDKSIVQNFINILTKDFLQKQITKLESITLEEFNANPILCTALNLKTPEEFVRYNAYQAIGRSIVTSMGYLVQDLYCILMNIFLTARATKKATEPNGI